MRWTERLACLLVGIAVLALAAVRIAGQTSLAPVIPTRPAGSKPVRLTRPRYAPVPESQWTDAHRKLVTAWTPDGPPGNDVKTLLNVPELVNGLTPFHTYITRHSSLLPRHRELLILRTAWILADGYTWSAHAAIAKKQGLTNDEVRRVAQGPDARGWAPFEGTLLHLADELYRNSSVTEATWKALSASYDMYHMMDAVMTVTEFTNLSLLYNSMGIQPDAGAADRLPTDVPYRVVVPDREPPLKTPRIQPLEGRGINISRTFANYPKLAEARTNSNYVNSVSKLDARYRELLILRTGWDCQAEYEWAEHIGREGAKAFDPKRIVAGPGAPGWDSIESLLVTAADELYRDGMVSDATWAGLAKRFDSTMMVNIVMSAAGYRLVSMSLNALGVQIEPTLNLRFPPYP
jgi:4-carboxymuconolactone decarboxylase